MSSSSSCAARSEASCGDPPSRGGGRGRTPRQPPRARVVQNQGCRALRRVRSRSLSEGARRPRAQAPDVRYARGAARPRGRRLDRGAHAPASRAHPDLPGPRPSRARGKADGGHRDGGKFHAGGGPRGRTRALRGPGRTLQPRRPGVPPPSQSAAIHRGAPARPDRAPRHRRGRDPGSHDPRPGSGALAHEVAGNRGARRGGPGADAAHRHRERATHVRERLRGEPDREPRLPRENTQDSLLRDERVPLDRLPEPERREAGNGDRREPDGEGEQKKKNAGPASETRNGVSSPDRILPFRGSS